MKKILMMMAVAVGLTSFAAQNDRLISFYTEGPDKYEDGTVIMDGERCALVWVKTGSVFGGFETVDADNYRVLEYASCGLNGHFEAHVFRVAHDLDQTLSAAGSYQVLLLDTRNEAKDALSELGQDGVPSRINKYVNGIGTMGEQVEEFENLELPGPDCYADGTIVREGEIYALVWMKDGAAFKGFRNASGENVPVLCVDEANNWFYCVYGRADAQGKCVKDSGVVIAEPQGYANGHFAIFLMDTRKPGTNELTERDNGNLPMFLQGYCEVEHTKTAMASGWTPVKITEESDRRFAFDPSLVLGEGFAAVYSRENGQDTWTVHAMPKAWAEKQSVNTVFETADDLYVLRAPAKPLAFPCTNEVDYVFHVAKTPEMRALIAKVVANKPLLAAIMANASMQELMPYLEGFTPEELALMQGELSVWASAVMPFFKWNADFAVSFDRGVTNGTVFLDGQYDGAAKWGFNTWVGSAFKDDLAAGEEIRLLKQGYQEVYLNYAEICTNVIQFKCGAMNFSPDNWGTRMTVKLRLYENTGRCNETKSSFTVDTYEYAFKGPLNVEYYVGGELHATLTTNHDGRTEFPLLAYQTGDPNLAFTGWTNENGVAVKVIPRMIREVSDENPVKTWYAGGADTLKLYAAFKEAKTTEVTVKPTGEAQPVPAEIKVTKDWIKENIGEDATDQQIQAALNETRESEGGKIPVWQTYVLGLDSPSGNVAVVATEKLDDKKALVISTVQAPPPDSGFKVTYSLDKIDKDTEEPIDDKHKGVEQETKDISIDLEPQNGEVPTGYYKMNVFITPEVNGEEKSAEKVQVKSEVTVGVLTVKTEEPVVPVAIPWTSLAGKGDDAEAKIPADEIVQPQGLSEGDELFVYNREGEVYTTLTLHDGKWVADGQTIPVSGSGDAGESTQPGVVPLAGRGDGIWLKRKDPTSAFHLFGQYNTTEASTKIEKPAPEKKTPEYNLIAPTGIEDTDLNTIPSLAPGVGGEKDKLMIVESGVPTYYDYKSGEGWGYDQQIIKVTASGKKRISTQRVNKAKVSAGIGLWYISAGGEPTINWSERTPSAQ